MGKAGLEPRHYRAIEFLQSYGKLQYRGMNRDQTIELIDLDPEHAIAGKTNKPQQPIITLTKKELLERSKKLANEKYGDRKA